MTFFADDRALALYSQELRARAATAETPSRLGHPDVSARAFSPICGSEVEVDLCIAPDGRVSAFGCEADSCTLAKACLAVVKEAAIGKTREEIRQAGERLKSMLGGGDDRMTGDWSGLEILRPARDYRARHNAILLPFEAVEKAFWKRGN